jgi:hypothetical protein
MNELEKLTAQRDAIQTRRQRRSEANKKDWEELQRLEAAIERATAKTLKGQTVVLNPNTSIQNAQLRKLRGMTAIVQSVGRKYLHVCFANGESWRIGFSRVVQATPELLADTSGEVTDSVTDSLNVALARM